MSKAILISTGLATGVASIIFAVTVSGFSWPPQSSAYDRAKNFEEVENFLEKYPSANITTPFYDCVEYCQPRPPTVEFSYLQPDRTKYAYLWVDLPETDSDSMPIFTVMCGRTGDSHEFSIKANGTRIENMTTFLNNERCPSFDS